MAPKKDIVAKLRRLQALVLDCDGVLSDGRLFYSKDGAEMLSFSARDGLGLAIVCKGLNFPVFVVSGRPTDIVEARYREIGIRAFVRSANKRETVRALAKEHGFEIERCAFVGDDWIDLGAFDEVGLSIAVQDAEPEVVAAADWVTHSAGGHGAVREVCDALIKACGHHEKILKKMLEDI